MTRLGALQRLTVASVLALLASLAGACASSRDALPAPARGWADGPVRWLILPEEMRRLRRLDSSPEMIAFIEEFWRRRDPDPAAPGNAFAQRFFERVQSADLLYTGEGVPGSLTDRGRALVLLGAPRLMRTARRTTPSWEALDAQGRSTSSLRVRVEVWGYAPEDLDPLLKARLAGDDGGAPTERFEVVFVEERARTRLVEGEELLEEAARAAVIEPEG